MLRSADGGEADRRCWGKRSEQRRASENFELALQGSVDSSESLSSALIRTLASGFRESIRA